MHIFIGDELVAFRNQFASIFRKNNQDIADPYFSALSVSSSNNVISITTDTNGDNAENITLNKGNFQTDLINYFESAYSRRVTVANEGNRSLVVILWMLLYTDTNIKIATQLIEALQQCPSNIKIEISGFTYDSVTCFIPNSTERQAPSIYKKCFQQNIAILKQYRYTLTAFRLIANRNMQDVALNFDQDVMARVCAEYSALMCRNYLTIHNTIVESETLPFESFGISSIKFDCQYYRDYLKKRIILDLVKTQNIDNQCFNLNTLSRQSDPILSNIIAKIRTFYTIQTTNAKARLHVAGSTEASSIVAAIDDELNEILLELETNIDSLLQEKEITIFEREALLSLILGDDSEAFEVSAVDADEIIVDDIIEEATQFLSI